MITGENQREVRGALFDEIQVLENRVRSSAVPRVVDPHFGWHRGDVLTESGIEERPAVTEMLLERVRLVLRQDEDPPQARVEAIAQREVGDAILAAKGYGWFRAIDSERVKS